MSKNRSSAAILQEHIGLLMTLTWGRFGSLQPSRLKLQTAETKIFLFISFPILGVLDVSKSIVKLGGFAVAANKL